MIAASSTKSNRVQLIDNADGPGRTTATLLASLAARLSAMYFVSGADAIGTLAAGFAALGREVSHTAKGASLRRAIEASRPGVNGDAIWTKLRISEWASNIPPSPILDEVRNDLALLLADDLEATLELIPIPNPMASTAGSQPPEPVTFIDYILGLWAFSSELTRLIETLAVPTLAASDEMITSNRPSPEPENVLLR